MNRLKTIHATGAWTTLVILLWTLTLPCSVAAGNDNTSLTTVPAVDLNRYLGIWYEIASYPAWFQKGCTGSTAEYAQLPDGHIQVTNRCFKKNLDGPLKESNGMFFGPMRRRLLISWQTPVCPKK